MKSETKEEYKTHLKDTMKFIAKRSKRLLPNYEKIDDVFRCYDQYETIIQRNMKKKDDILTEDDFMDHHKIAAILCCSVLKVKPIETIMKKSGKKLHFTEKNPNEICACLLGLEAIQRFWNKKKNEIIKKQWVLPWFKKSFIKLPKPGDKKNTYTDWFAKLLNEEALEHLDYESDKFEPTIIFLISHIYFLIENYSFKYYKF